MAKKITSLSSIEIEAVAHFHTVANALGITSGQFGPLEITKGDYLDGKDVTLETYVNRVLITSRMFFQKPNGVWIFCGITNNQFNADGLGWRAEFRFWKDAAGARYEIKKHSLAGGYDVFEVEVKSRERVGY